MKYSMILGDNRQTLKSLPDNSIDSVVTDPPYGLSNVSPQQLKERISKLILKSFDIKFPKFNQSDSKSFKDIDLSCIPIQGSDLGSKQVLPIIKSWIGMPECTVDLNSDVEVGQKEVQTCAETPSLRISNAVLMDKINTQGSQFLGDYILDFGDSVDFSSGNMIDGDFSEFVFGSLRVPISSIDNPGLPGNESSSRSSDCSPGKVFENVGFSTDSRSNTVSPSFVLTSSGTENHPVLCFVRGTSMHIDATITTFQNDCGSTFLRPKLVRTFLGASSFLSSFDQFRVNFIIDSTNGTVPVYIHVYIPKKFINNLFDIYENWKGFMGKNWDQQVPGPDYWKEVFRVLKPGGYILAFGGTRTFHRLVCAIEDSGFEVRDTIMWVYSTGFPKSYNISKALHKKQEDSKKYDGFGTALKPAYEPILLARKPITQPVAENVLQYGTGALNIDACRIGTEERYNPAAGNKPGGNSLNLSLVGMPEDAEGTTARGRFPANFIHDGSDEVLDLFPNSKSCSSPSDVQSESIFRPKQGSYQKQGPIYPGENGSAARFFYCAKASKKDREEYNDHPTVKPTNLMRYLCRLVTPPGGTVLDPFAGSGSTGKAALLEKFNFIGCELDEKYFQIAEKRLQNILNNGSIPNSLPFDE